MGGQSRIGSSITQLSQFWQEFFWKLTQKSSSTQYLLINLAISVFNNALRFLYTKKTSSTYFHPLKMSPAEKLIRHTTPNNPSLLNDVHNNVFKAIRILHNRVPRFPIKDLNIWISVESPGKIKFLSCRKEYFLGHPKFARPLTNRYSHSNNHSQNQAHHSQ